MYVVKALLYTIHPTGMASCWAEDDCTLPRHVWRLIWSLLRNMRSKTFSGFVTNVFQEMDERHFEIKNSSGKAEDRK